MLTTHSFINSRETGKLKYLNFASQCFSDSNTCTARIPTATRKFTWKRTGNVDGFHVSNEERKLQAKNPCKFPFIYKNITYDSCTKKPPKKPYYDKLWCATTINDTNHATSWGYCDDCHVEDEDDESDDGAEGNEDDGKSKSWKIKPRIVIGILLGLLIVGLFIICYIYIRKKKGANSKNMEVTKEKAEVTVRYSLDPTRNESRAMINSEMILNDQAGLLSYSGEHEIERGKFEMRKKLG